MFQLVPYVKEHALAVIERNRIETGKVIPQELVHTMLLSYQAEGSMAFTLLHDNTPVACGGIINMGWHRGEAWVLASSLFYKFQREAYKAVRNYFPQVAKEGGFIRVQAVCVLDGLEGWFKHLGFEREGVLKAYGPNNEDVVMYSRIFGER